MVGNYCNLSSKKIEIIGCMTEKKGNLSMVIVKRESHLDSNDHQ